MEYIKEFERRQKQIEEKYERDAKDLENFKKSQLSLTFELILAKFQSNLDDAIAKQYPLEIKIDGKWVKVSTIKRLERMFFVAYKITLKGVKCSNDFPTYSVTRNNASYEFSGIFPIRIVKQ